MSSATKYKAVAATYALGNGIMAHSIYCQVKGDYTITAIATGQYLRIVPGRIMCRTIKKYTVATTYTPDDSIMAKRKDSENKSSDAITAIGTDLCPVVSAWRMIAYTTKYYAIPTTNTVYDSIINRWPDRQGEDHAAIAAIDRGQGGYIDPGSIIANAII